MSGAALSGVRDMYDRDAAEYEASRAPLLRSAGERAIANLSLAGKGLLLDVACGTGTGLEALQRASPGACVVGVDLSATMLRQAATPFPVVQADAAALPFAAASADAVLCCFALMHMVSPGAAIAEFARVLRPGGAVAVTTWGADRPWPARAAILDIIDSLGAPQVATSHHGAAATESAGKVAGLLAEAGFRDVTTATAPLDVREGFDLEATLRAWSSLGSTATRLACLDDAARAEYLLRARATLARFDPRDLADPHDVIYAWGRKGG